MQTDCKFGNIYVVHSVSAGRGRVYCTPSVEQLCLHVPSNRIARDGYSGRDMYAIIVVNC